MPLSGFVCCVCWRYFSSSHITNATICHTESTSFDYCCMLLFLRIGWKIASKSFEVCELWIRQAMDSVNSSTSGVLELFVSMRMCIWVKMDSGYLMSIFLNNLETWVVYYLFWLISSICYSVFLKIFIIQTICQC